jgi:hypothetical protein
MAREINYYSSKDFEPAPGNNITMCHSERSEESLHTKKGMIQ